MKIAEYKQMMEYLTRPGFNGGGSVRNKTVLPKKKPEEEVKKRKIKNFEKAKPALENPKEVKEMIDKPKRGLVDEPGSYSGNRRKREKGEFVIKIEKLKKIKNDYLKFVKDSLKKGDLSKVGFFGKYVRDKYSEQANSIVSAYNDRGIPKPSKEVLFKARNSLAKKLVVNPNLTLKEITFKLTGGPYSTLTGVPGIEMDTLPKPKYKKELGQGGAKKVKGEVSQLLKSKIITDKLKANKFPTISDISKVLKSDPTVSETRLTDLADALQDSNVSQKIKNLASNYLEKTTDQRTAGGKKARYIYEKRFKNLMGLEETLPVIRKNILDKITNVIPQLQGLINVDEIGSLTASMRRGSGPYAIFGQVLGSDFNEVAKGNTIDGIKSLTQRKINSLPVDSPERLEEIKKYNAKVDAFEAEANKNNPIKKVKGQKISLKPPSETIKNKKVYNQYKDLFDDHYKKYGYSFEVAANTDSIPDISKKLDNKAFQNTVKNRFTKLIGKGGKFGALVGLGTLAGTGFALADQPGVQEATSVLPTAAAAGTGAAAVGTKTGRNILGKIFRGAGTPLAGLGFAGTNVASKMKEGQSLADAVVDPITGLELSFPGLFKENLSKIISERAASAPGLKGAAAKFGRGLLGLGRIGRLMTPVGLTLAAAGQAQEFYNQRQNLQRMKEQNPRAYSEFMSRRVAPAFSTAEQTAIEDMGRSGAAGGGIMKMAGKSSGRPPESGPTPQGLDFLMKRGR